MLVLAARIFTVFKCAFYCCFFLTRTYAGKDIKPLHDCRSSDRRKLTLEKVLVRSEVANFPNQGYWMSIWRSTGKMHLLLFTLYVFAVEWKTHLCQCTCRTRLIDLTHPFDEHVQFLPGTKNFKIDAVKHFKNNPNTCIEEYSSGTHAGTHFEAPCLLLPNTTTVSDFPIENLIAFAAVVDIQKKVNCNPDYRLQVQDLQEWEHKTGQLLKDIVLIRSGWGKRWANRTAFIGNCNNDNENMHFPGISASAARWLVKNRKVHIVGVETLLFDYGPSKKYPVHKIFFQNNIYGLENVANMEELPLYGATLYVVPMKISGTCAAPTRVLATIPETMTHDCKVAKAPKK